MNPLNSVFTDAVAGQGSQIITYNNDVIVSGDFVMNDGTHARLLNYNSNGINPSFHPSFDGPIHTMVIDGSTLYVGGGFTHVNGQIRNHLCAFDLSNYSLTGWSPSANDDVRVLLASNGSILAGGNFTAMNGNGRNYFALIGSGGSLNPLNIPFNNAVNALAIYGSTLFCGGAFTAIDTFTRAHLAAFDMQSGMLAPDWIPETDDEVSRFVLDNSTLYVLGKFHFLNTLVNRNYVMSFDLTTGLPTTFNPSPNDEVYDLAVSNSLIYMAGAFSYIGANEAPYFARITSSGAITPGVPLYGNSVRSVLIKNDSCLTTGDFTSAGGVRVSNLIALDYSTGMPTGFAPQIDDEVEVIKFASDALFVGGSFNTINQTFSPGIAMIDTLNGNPYSWNAACNGVVHDIEIIGTKLYAGGLYTTMGGENRTNLAELDLNTASATTWDPQVGGAVYSLEYNSGKLYVGGSFNTVSSFTRNNIARYNLLSNLSIDSWAPTINNTVLTIRAKNEAVFIGGSFTQINSTGIEGIAKLDTATTAGLINWNAGISGNVSCIDISGSMVCAGGDFSIGNQNGFAMMNTSDATLVPYHLSGNIMQLNYTRIDYGRMYMGGQFSLSDAKGKSNFAILDMNSNTPSIAASNVQTSEITTVSMRIRFTKGNGTKHIVVASAGTPVSSLPVDGSSYTSGSGFGLGDYLNTNDNIVYIGSDSTFVLTNLTPGTTYYFKVFEFNGFANFTKFLTANSAGNSATTLLSYNAPTIAASNISFSSVTNTSMTVKWNSGNGSSRIVIAREASAVSVVPSDATNYPATSGFANGPDIGSSEYVVYNGSGDSVQITNLKQGVSYYYAVFEFNGFDMYAKYLKTNPAVGNQQTVALASEPSTGASALSFSERTDSSFKVSWTNGNGASRMVIASQGILPGYGLPVDGNSYQADAKFTGIGSTLGSNDRVVYIGSGNSFTLTGLIPATTYYVRVIEFNGNGFSSNYNITSILVGSYSSDFLIKRPSKASSNIRIASLNYNSAVIKWTKGDGDYRLMAVHKGSPVTAKPSDGVFYHSNIRFGRGDTLSDHSFVVFESDGDSAVITQLEGNTQYYFSLFEFSIDPGNGPIFQSIASADSSFITLENSVEEIGTSDLIRVFPNPATQFIQVDASALHATCENIRVIDLQGKLLLETQSNSSQVHVNLNGLEQGFYLMEIQTNKGNVTRKIQIQ